MSFKFNIGEFSEEVAKEEEEIKETSTAEKQTTDQEEKIEAVDLNKLSVDLDDLDLGDISSFTTTVIKELGFDSLDALKAAGDGGVQIANLLDKFNSKIEEVTSTAKTKYKELADLPVVKQAKALEKIKKEFEANNTEWQADFLEVAGESVDRLKTLPADKIPAIEKEIDRLVSDFLIGRQIAGKKLINPYIALQGKIEKLITQQKPPVKDKPVQTTPNKNLASLSGGGSSANTKEFNVPAGTSKKQATMLNMFSGLINNLKEI